MQPNQSQYVVTPDMVPLTQVYNAKHLAVPAAMQAPLMPKPYNTTVVARQSAGTERMPGQKVRR